MHDFSESSFLESQVLTASPQRLRLMLIEGALRFTRQTLERLHEGKVDFALDSYQRARDILAECLASLRQDQTPLTREVRLLYFFLINELTRGYHHQAPGAVENVIRLLEMERATWAEVCEQMPLAPNPALLPPLPGQAAEITSHGVQALPPIRMPHYGESDALACFGEAESQLSIEI